MNPRYESDVPRIGPEMRGAIVAVSSGSRVARWLIELRSVADGR
jgi:hypothetical protein